MSAIPLLLKRSILWIRGLKLHHLRERKLPEIRDIMLGQGFYKIIQNWLQWGNTLESIIIKITKNNGLKINLLNKSLDLRDSHRAWSPAPVSVERFWWRCLRPSGVPGPSFFFTQRLRKKRRGLFRAPKSKAILSGVPWNVCFLPKRH